MQIHIVKKDERSRMVHQKKGDESEKKWRLFAFFAKHRAPFDCYTFLVLLKKGCCLQRFYGDVKKNKNRKVNLKLTSIQTVYDIECCYVNKKKFMSIPRSYLQFKHIILWRICFYFRNHKKWLKNHESLKQRKSFMLKWMKILSN